MTTPENIALTFMGGGSGGIARMVLTEAVLNGGAEALSLPGEFRAADALNNPDPNAATRIATGFLVGGAFPLAIIGAGKGARALDKGTRALWARVQGRTASLNETLPPGVDRIDHEAGVEAAEAALRGDQTVDERLQGGARAEAAPGTMGDILDDPAPGTLPPASAGGLVDRWRVGTDPQRDFRRESGGDYNALFGYQNRKGGKFANVKLTEMTVDQAIAFSAPSGPYGQWVKSTIGRVATPMGAYQIVGTTLRAAKKGLGLKGDEVMTPELQELLGQWIYRQQGTGAWEGYRGPRDSFNPAPADRDAPSIGTTSRGYTGQGQVAVGDDTRIDVDYEVVDYRSLIRASGDLQPRDRSRINSDAWVADTAARLDPAQLMPSPTADRGTPIVGPDNVIESGNGRSMAIARAYERHPDRAEAYRGAIEAAGYQIPEGVDQPVLIARRRTDLTPDQRRQMVIDAQDSGVAQMTPTEVARATARNLQSPILSRLDPSAPLASDANGGFVRAALATLPRSARNAMFDPSGALNALGQRQLKEALFARAWDAPDILARYTEGAPAELKSLIEALETAAPAQAALKADIEAGLVTPEMDISPFVLDAMRLIGAARDLAAKGTPMAKAIAELLDEVDLMQGAVSPLTTALVRKMWRNGRAAPADEIAAFLTRYADEARKAGAAGGMFDAPSPRDVLRTIDPETFADLPEDFGQARGFATRATSEAPAEAVRTLPDQGFDQGARSAEAEAVHAEIEAELRGPDEGPFGPVIEGYGGKWRAAAAELERRQTGEVPDALTHPEVGKIALVWGEAGNDDGKGFGLAKLLAWHPEVLDDLQGHLSRATIIDSRTENRINLRSDTHKFGVRLDYSGIKKTWLLTGFEFGKRRSERSSARLQDIWDGSTSPSPPSAKDSPDLGSMQPGNAQGGGDRSMGRTAGLSDGSSPPAALPAKDTPPASPVQDPDPRASGDGQGMLSGTPPGTEPAPAPDAVLSRPSGEALTPIDTAALALERARRELGEFAAFEIDLPDGTSARASDILDDLDADRATDAQVTACATSSNGARHDEHGRLPAACDRLWRAGPHARHRADQGVRSTGRALQQHHARGAGQGPRCRRPEGSERGQDCPPPPHRAEQLQAMSRLRNTILTAKDPAAAIKSLLEYNPNAGSKSESVRSLTEAYVSSINAAIRETLEATGTNVFSNTRNAKLLENLIRELHDEATGDPLAKALAATVRKEQQRMRRAFNSFGGDIGDLADFGVSHSHDAGQLRLKGFDTWAEKIRTLLAWDRIIDNSTGKPFAAKGDVPDAAEVQTFLKDVYDGIITRGWDYRDPSLSMGGRALANQRAEHRVLHFKNGSAWIDYNREFGTSTPSAP